MTNHPGFIEPRQRLSAIGWSTTAVITAFLCLTQIGMMLCIQAGRFGTALIAPTAWVAAMLLGDWLGRRAGLAGRDRWWLLAIANVALVGAISIAAWYFDLSWDGQWYHQTGVYAIARDWNPLTDPLRAFLPHLELWVRHYAKGPWYVGAAIYSTTGQIELGKCTSALTGAAVGAATFASCIDWGFGRRRAAMVALLVTLNPVWLSELTTYLVDGIMIGFLVVAAAAVASALRRPQPIVIWVGIMASIATINAKFTGLVFLCFVFAAGWCWCALQRRGGLWRYTGLTALALVLGTLVWGYNPYVTNTLYRHQPFYPVLGSAAFPSLTQQGKEGIIRYETPKNFLLHNRLVRLVYATFGRPGNAPYGGVRNGALMWPFTATPDDLSFYHYHETRLAGFGPYFSGAWLMALGLGVWLLFQRSTARWAAVLIVAAIAGSLLISPHLWWARYGPQLWLLPIVHLDWETHATQTLRQQLVELRQSGREIEISLRYFEIPVGERLKTWGIPFRPKRSNEIRDGLPLMSVVDRYPGQILYRFAPVAPKE